MPGPSNELIQKLGAFVAPFERRNSLSTNGAKLSVKPEEEVQLLAHCLSSLGTPDDARFTTLTESKDLQTDVLKVLK
ncbi:hypothetical protein ACSBL2_13550 [Pedobacter sp. AW31-3R]|uniref:hypothetical protein n=1 Tax=Pedobacter sp. AW31-3R TaxID=3445781 RepID=UPI003FA03EDA